MTAHTLYGATELQPFRHAEGPDYRRGEFYVYALAINTGVLKVGRTIYPTNRIRAHIRDAAIYGASITSAWMSVSHVNYEDNEKALIRYCRDRATSQIAAEYFTGVSLPQVIEFAESLKYRRGEPITHQPIRIPDLYLLDRERLKRVLGLSPDLPCRPS